MWVALSYIIGLVINGYVIIIKSKKYSLFPCKRFNNFKRIIWVGIFLKYQIIFRILLSIEKWLFCINNVSCHIFLFKIQVTYIYSKHTYYIVHLYSYFVLITYHVISM